MGYAKCTFTVSSTVIFYRSPLAVKQTGREILMVQFVPTVTLEFTSLGAVPCFGVLLAGADLSLRKPSFGSSQRGIYGEQTYANAGFSPSTSV